MADTLVTSDANTNVVVDPNANANTNVVDPTKVVDPNAKVVDPNANPDPNTPEAKAKAEEMRRAALTPEQRKAEDDSKAAADAKQKENFGAPEKYELKAPEGATVNAEVTTKFETLAKDLNLSPAAAQRLYDLGIEASAKNFEALSAKIDTVKTEWATTSKADKEFGGDNFDSNLAVAKKALDLGTPELRQLLNESGFGNHPEVIRWMYRVGKTMKQDEHVNGVNGTNPPKTPQSMFPNSKMNP